MATSRNAHCGLVVMLALAAVGPIVVAAQTAPIAISLRLRDTAQVPHDVLIPAQEEVTRIYRAAGVEPCGRTWKRCQLNRRRSGKMR